jgi:prepilin signal peptidase PulO-like enzyme (type II secretory pathway)
MATLFVVSFIMWPMPLQTTLQIAQFTLWLVAVVMLVILFAYDLKWFLLPDRVMMPLIAVAGLIAITHIAMAGTDTGSALISMAGGITILSGLYLALWLISKGAWIGFGDVKLGLALALMLGDWMLAFLVLFIANFVGLVIVLPGLLLGKLSRTARIPFGPLLITGGVIVMLTGGLIAEWYISGLGLTSLFGA